MRVNDGEEATKEERGDAEEQRKSKERDSPPREKRVAGAGLEKCGERKKRKRKKKDNKQKGRLTSVEAGAEDVGDLALLAEDPLGGGVGVFEVVGDVLDEGAEAAEEAPLASGRRR